MSNIKILDKDVKVNGNKIVLKQTTEKTYLRFDLENSLMNVRRQKLQLLEQNKKMISQYNLLIEKEKEIIAWMNSVPDEEMQNI